MTAETVVTSRLEIMYGTSRRETQVRDPSSVTYKTKVLPQSGTLANVDKLLLAVPTLDARHFLLLFPQAATNMTVLWNGVDSVAIPSLFITTDDGYEVSGAGVITPITVTNGNEGPYRFILGEDPDDYRIFPGGTTNSDERYPD